MKYFVIYILVMTISGCGISRHYGNSAVANFDAKTFIVKGETTKSDILEKLGPPQSTQKKTISQDIINNPKMPPILKAPELWIYWSNNIQGSAVVLPFVATTSTNYSSQTITIYFDDNGIVLDYFSNTTNM